MTEIRAWAARGQNQKLEPYSYMPGELEVEIARFV
jgi:hypothetical protein